MAAPMGSNAWRCSLAGSARTGIVAGVPPKRSSLRVRRQVGEQSAEAAVGAAVLVVLA